MKLKLLTALALLGLACKSPEGAYQDADRVADDLTAKAQIEALGEEKNRDIRPYADDLRRRLIKSQGLSSRDLRLLSSADLEKPEHWEEDFPKSERRSDGLGELHFDELSPKDALQIAAAYNRGYQAKKEEIFEAALDLDLEELTFRSTYAGLFDSLLRSNQESGSVSTTVENSFSAEAMKTLKNGARLSAKIVFDLTRMFSTSQARANGVYFDTSINIPLLAGSGRHIVTENLTQAQRDLIYRIWEFEQLKQTLAVRVSADFLQALRQRDQAENAAANYKKAILSANRARRLAEAGRLPETQVAQTVQRELEARNRWVRAEEDAKRSLDNLKITLGLPTDCRLGLDPDILQELTDQYKLSLQTDSPAPDYEIKGESIRLIRPSRINGGPFEIDEKVALKTALQERFDLKVREGRVFDSQRRVIIARDALRARFDLTSSYSTGGRRSGSSVTSDDIGLDFRKGVYEAGIDVDLPWERTREAYRFRESYIALERSLRSYQETEDQVKLQVRENLRSLLKSRSSFLIELNAVELADRRVKSTSLFLEAGRVQVRDLLDAQDDLVEAQDNLTSAIVAYRLNELAIQRDMGILELDEKGLIRNNDAEKQ